jgi:threonine dehydrogenase-like Zn-dependent dehydrogenase
MKQILQDLSNGQTFLKEAPAPSVSSGSIIIETQKSLISAGTERMLVDFGRASILQKAKQQPDKVRQVIEKARTDGIATTIDAVRSKLDQPIPLGYSNIGIIRETGPGVSGFRKGDRVVSNGPHADVVRVPQNLCARVPEEVDDESAAFAIVASIGLQGIR